MILIDPPSVPARGRLWSHLVSDTSLTELHAFADRVGIPRLAFDRDHYDIPADRYAVLVEAGAVPVSAKELVARLAGSGLRRRKHDALGARPPGGSRTRPRRLVPGDRVRVVAPAGPVGAGRLAAGIAVLEGWGLVVEVADGVATGGPLPHLAADDAVRARDLVEAWCDPGVAAVWAVRGGFGSQRVLDLLDLAAMEAAGPCLLVGFSDVTALHAALGDRLGVATLHAPGVAGLGELDAGALDRVHASILGAAPSVLRGRWLVSADGALSGPLVGGNLALLASAQGTPDAGSALAAVALLEDVAEPPYRVDRMVTQLLRSGWFDGVRAVVCGDFTRCGDPAEVEAVLRARLGGVAPVLVGLPVGHGPVNEPVLLGARARLTPDGTLHVAGLR